MHARLHKLADEFNKESKLFKIWLKSTKAKPKTISFSMCDPNEFSKKLYSTATIPVVGLIKWLPNITATSFQTEKEFGNHLNTVIALSSVHSKKFDWMVHRCKDIFTYYIIKDGRVERVPSHYVDYFKECKSFLSHIGITKKWLFSYKTGVQHDYAQGLDPNKPGVYEIPPSFVPVNLLIDNQLRFISEVEKPAKFNSADSKFAREVLRLLKKLYPPIEEKQQVPVELETHFVYDIHKTCWFVRLSHMLWRDNGDDESCIDLSENCVAKLLESNDKSNCLRDFIETANVQSEHYVNLKTGEIYKREGAKPARKTAEEEEHTRNETGIDRLGGPGLKETRAQHQSNRSRCTSNASSYSATAPSSRTRHASGEEEYK
eukprot:GHVT01074053.1.p1 GENE.GHVT01074053.1~~GHVT01074053.1.p1  ORF type:complete len:375 (-),score=22.80 GHVT01074053.1:166-1290(-)